MKYHDWQVCKLEQTQCLLSLSSRSASETGVCSSSVSTLGKLCISRGSALGWQSQTRHWHDWVDTESRTRIWLGSAFCLVVCGWFCMYFCEFCMDLSELCMYLSELCMYLSKLCMYLSEFLNHMLRSPCWIHHTTY